MCLARMIVIGDGLLEEDELDWSSLGAKGRGLTISWIHTNFRYVFSDLGNQ